MWNQGWPQTQVEFNTSNTSEGYKVLQTKLRAAFGARMETCNTYIDRDCPKAHEKDPMERLPFKIFIVQA